jgi:hypothetical protein
LPDLCGQCATKRTTVAMLCSPRKRRCTGNNMKGAYLNQNEKENMGKFDNRTVETFWSPELSKKATEGGRRGEKTGQ